MKNTDFLDILRKYLIPKRFIKVIGGLFLFFTVVPGFSRELGVETTSEKNAPVESNVTEIRDITQQVKDIRGTVTDKQGEPLIGVSIAIKGTTIGSLTDIDGKFSIKASAGQVLVVRYVGYVDQEITVGSSTNLNITLEESNIALDEVVITAPIGVQRPPREIGYSVSSVSSKQLTEAGNTNFASALYGKAAGVKITTPPGGATGAVNVQIRGVNSLNYQQQPLYVVDGVMIRTDGQNGARGANNNGYWDDQRIRGNGVADINPQDIETLTVLKGASASALYGSDAGNGVIVITTKKGSRDRGLGIELNYDGAFESVANLPKFQNLYGPGYGPETNLTNGADIDGWYIQNPGTSEAYKRPWFSAYGQFGPKYDGREVSWWDGTKRPYSAQKNSMKELFQVGYTSNLNLALSKQTDAINYRFSYSRLDYTGTQLNSEMQKNTFNLSSLVNIHKNLTLDVTASYVNTNTFNRPQSMTQVFASYGGFFSTAEDLSLFKERYKTSEGYKYVTYANRSRNPEEAFIYSMRPTNLLDYMWNRLKDRYEEKEDRLITSGTLNWSIAPKLKLRGRLGNDFTAVNIQDKRFTEYLAIPEENRSTGSFEITKNQYSIIYGDALLTYDGDFNSDLRYTIAGGMQGREETYRSQRSSTGGGLAIDNWFSLNNSFSTLNTSSSVINHLKYAYLGILNLSYRNLLFLETTARQEYNSALPPGNNDYFYWSANTGFIFSDAVKLPEWMTFGKLRASYGVVGNGSPAYVANLGYNMNVLQTPSGSIPSLTLYSDRYGNLDLKPEMKHEWEFGLETRFWQDRISFDASFYTNKVKNQIANYTLPYSSGARSQILNIGTIGSTGLELAASVMPFVGDFRWTSRFNVGFNKSKVINYNYGIDQITFWSEDQGSIRIAATEGERLGNIYAYDLLRNESGTPYINDDGYYIVDKSKFIKVGNIMPTAVGGWLNSFDYKNFSLDIAIDYRFGGQMVSPNNKYQTGAGRYEQTLQYRDLEHGGIPWTYTRNGVNYQRNDGLILNGLNVNTGQANGKVISAADYYMNTFTWGEDGWNDAMVQDNSFIKMRELTLAYRVPESVGKKLAMKNVRVALFGRNLFYIWKTLDNIDPEAPIGSMWYSQGIDTGASVASKVIGFSINAKF